MRYRLYAETRCDHYPDGARSDVPIETQYDRTFRTLRGARRRVRRWQRDGCKVTRWAIWRGDNLIDKGAA